MSVIEGLMTFGNRELFIINTETSGLISMNALPLAFKYKDSGAETVGNIVLGEQSEQVYNPTNNSEIALAFREAGESFGS